MVLLGEMRQTLRIFPTFTRPYFGTARSMSKTFAVSTYAGGWSSSCWIDTRPPFRSRLSWARRVRMSLARCRASIRCVRLRSGAADGLAMAVSVGVGGMGGEYTERVPTRKPKSRNSARPRPEVDASSGDLTPDGAICSGFLALTRESKQVRHPEIQR